MILVDTSVWIEILREKRGPIVRLFRERIGDDIYVLTRFTQLELLQGARDETEWKLLDEYLSTQYYLEASETTWKEAARIYFDLRRKGTTINSPIDCCIAQIAIETGALLLHRDEDFSRIARIRHLAAERFDPKGAREKA
jgi:predicted nucleic acid-binding protein